MGKKKIRKYPNGRILFLLLGKLLVVMRRFETLNRKLNMVPSRGIQAAAIILAGALVPAYFIWGDSSWKQSWTVGAFVSLGVYLMVVAGLVLLVFGVTGGNVTSKEQDKEIGEQLDRYYQRYWWIPFTLCLLWAAYGVFKFYA
jgi:drug/metabolite transporter (DMT)-like permease